MLSSSISENCNTQNSYCSLPTEFVSVVAAACLSNTTESCSQPYAPRPGPIVFTLMGVRILIAIAVWAGEDFLINLCSLHLQLIQLQCTHTHKPNHSLPVGITPTQHLFVACKGGPNKCYVTLCSLSAA